MTSVRPADLATATRIRADLASGVAREARIATGVSGADVARAIGVSDSAVFYWETGRYTPRVAHALAYGKMLARLGRKAAA